jgi:hypothetical protein
VSVAKWWAWPGRILETFGNIIWHANVTGEVGVVTIQMKSDVEIFRPVNCYSVPLFKDVDEVLSMFLTDVLESKIVDYKTERDGTGFM